MFLTGNGQSSHVFTFGPFTVDRTAGVLSDDGRTVVLPPKAFGVLLVLLERPGAVVARDDLLREVWRDAVVTDASLTEAVRTLRQALGDDSQQPTYIQTVHRRGYRFVARVEVGTAGPPRERNDLPAQSDGPTPDVEPPRPRRSMAGGWLVASLLGLLGVVALLAHVTGVMDPLLARPTPDLYVTDYWLDAVQRFDGRDGTQFMTFASGDLTGGPGWMACAPNGNLLVTRINAREVAEFDNATGARLRAFASTNLARPQALTVGGPNQNLFVSDLSPARSVVEFDGRTGEFIRVFASFSGEPFGLAFGPNGNLFVVLRRPDPTLPGGVEELDGKTGAVVGRYNSRGPVGSDVAFGPAGTFFVTVDRSVLEFEVGNPDSVRTLVTGLFEPHGLRFGPNGNLFVAEPRLPGILEIDPATGAVVRPFATSGFDYPIALLFGEGSDGPCGPT